MPDISAQLEVIRTNPYGEPVKTAVRDALSILAESRGGDIVEELPHGVANDSQDGLYEVYEIGAYNYPFTYTQENNDYGKLSATLTIKLSKPSLLIATAMSRSSPVTVDGDGWTKIAVCGPDPSFEQYVTAYSKKVDAGTYSVTLRQPSNLRMSMKLIAIVDADHATVIENTTINQNRITHYFPAKTGKKRLYLHSLYWYTEGEPVYFIGSMNVALNETRFYAFLSYLEDTETEYITSYEPVTSLALDIE